MLRLKGSKNFYALNDAVTLEITRFAYGFWSDGFLKNLEDGPIGKLLQFQKIKMKMLS